ncbi:NAD(P)-dependent oxidoreductase [Alloacidobacterium dinghuense]|uniref:NAD(P)-dependent oxidoreductase n=1 Tax=Alloacidobacterium dinghuense TaxID=2763107 RepID=A0A7G8BCJ9_9BACT|nr:NAD(P)-dependent oxidoreductase [Alloacidobacterium dinghuense]QNI30269.1 NAD(P)-dependent oxidoreductase [Alloacidobacterium dinghuense]
MKQVVIFGGTGFIGTHTAQRLLREFGVEQIVLVDINPPQTAPYAAGLRAALGSGKARFVQHDIRQPMPVDALPNADLIFNFAAVHREPGHQPSEYYETNLLGAMHVCNYADAVNCNHIVFTSSISPYAVSEESKHEESLPVPETPYGGSKLVAEKMHTAWQKAAPGRRLLIVRPGVVFGPGEGGNVTRLIHSLTKGYFAYMGNKATRKAGGYVKELTNVFLFGVDYQKRNSEGLTLLNFSVQPTPALSQYVEAIRKVGGINREPHSIPRGLLLGVSYPVEFIARIFGIKQPVSPTRIRKLYRSTNIEPRRLQELGYAYQYSLEESFEDWKKDKPEDFGVDPSETRLPRQVSPQLAP